MYSKRILQRNTFHLTDTCRSEIENASHAKNTPDPNVEVSRELTAKLTLIQKTTFIIFNDLPSDLTSDEAMLYVRQIFKIAHEMDSDDILDFMVVHINLMLCFFPTQKNIVLNTLKENGYDPLEDRSLAYFCEDRTSVDISDMSEYEMVNQQVMLSTLGIYLILIGKRLTTLNSAQWLKNRVRTFCQSAGISEEDGLVEICCPSETYSVSVYRFISPKFTLRRTLFETVFTNSSAGGLTGKIMKTCLTLLSGTEIGNFLLCHKFIIIENPILLCWQELAKFAPYLISAVEKFNSMGDKAMFCKFLYTQELLQELSRDKLRIFASIAREIAILEGFTSFENYKGTDTSTSTRELVIKAIEIVKRSGGCNTRVTEDLREAILSPKGNEEILAALSIGSHAQNSNDPAPIGTAPFNQ